MSHGDIVIVGGGPAGLTTAIALSRLEPRLLSRIVVLERARYPRDKYCAGAFGRRGEVILEQLDASPRVPSAPIEGLSMRVQSGERAVRVGPIGRVVRRIEFDHALAEIAKSRGIRIEEGTRVDGATFHARGADLATSQGTLHASVVVGCDGVGSVVRRTVGLGTGALRAQVLEMDTEIVPGDRDRALLHFDATDRSFAGYFWDFPTVVGGREMVCRGIYHLRTEGHDDVDIQALMHERLASLGLDASKCKNKRFAERGFEPTSRIAGASWMLVGEAAGIDPVTGEGIAQAAEYGALAARFLAETLRGTSQLEGWNDFVASSRLARDLSVRTWLVQAFYGAMRPRTERLVVEHEDTLRVGCQHFGALPIDRWRLARVMLRSARTLATQAWRDGIGGQ